MSVRRALWSPAFLVTFLLLAVTAVGMAVLPGVMDLYLRKKPLEARRHMREVSRRTASWEQVGQDQAEDAETLVTLGTRNTIARTYRERHPPAGMEPLFMELHLAYYTGMVDTVPHVSDRCMVGGGWVPLSGSRVIPVKLDTSAWRRAKGVSEEVSEGGTLSMARLPVLNPPVTDFPGTMVYLPYGLVAPVPGVDGATASAVPVQFSDFTDDAGAVSIIGHFFIANHRLTPSANQVRQLAFRLEDDYAYYVKVQVATTHAPGARGREKRAARVASAESMAEVTAGFLSEILPEVMLCLPDWIKVENERLQERLRRGQGGDRTNGDQAGER